MSVVQTPTAIMNFIMMRVITKERRRYGKSQKRAQIETQSRGYLIF